MIDQPPNPSRLRPVYSSMIYPHVMKFNEIRRGAAALIYMTHSVPFYLKQTTRNGQRIPFEKWDPQDQVREYPKGTDDEHTTTPAGHGQPDGQGEGTRNAGNE